MEEVSHPLLRTVSRGDTTLQALLSSTFLQTLPYLVTPLKGHSLSPHSCPAMQSAPSERFGYWYDCRNNLAPKHTRKHEIHLPWVKKKKRKKSSVSIQTIVVLFVLVSTLLAAINDTPCMFYLSCIVQELCESRGGRPGLSVLTSLLVSVDVKIYCTVLRHWSHLVPNMSNDL